MVCLVGLVAGSLGLFVKVVNLSVAFMSHGKHAYTNFKVFMKFVYFFNQVIGFIAVNQLLIDRIETFVFGGPDAVVSMEQRYLMEHYKARFVEAITHSEELTFGQKVAFFLAFDDIGR